MVLVRETTRGRLALRVGYASRWTGHSVNVLELDAEGWSSKLGDWGSYRNKQGSLEGFLTEEIGLPSDEAQRLAEEVISGFRDRGGEETLSRLEWVGAFAMLFYSLTRIYVLIPLLALGLVVVLALVIL